MPVVSLNTTGARPLKSREVLKDKPADEPVHYDSKVDKFNKRLQLVRKQRASGVEDVTEQELRDLSLYEFWWKYTVDRVRVRRVPRTSCLMVTPSFSADCADVEHSLHESYARAAVIAFWRHMGSDWRHTVIREVMTLGVKPVPAVFFGGTKFVDPSPHAASPDLDRFLGVDDLLITFEAMRDGRGRDEGWTLALMEMLTDPMLRQWVPDWLVEQYERQNPFFREVLTVQQEENLQRNKTLLKRAKREMIKRHALHKKGAAMKEDEKLSDAEKDGEESDGGESDSGKDLDDEVARLADADAEDAPHVDLSLIHI